MALLPDTKKIFTYITQGPVTLLFFLALFVLFSGCAHRADKLDKLKENSNIHYRLGNEYYKTGNISDAMKSYIKAISIYPEEPSYYLMLGFAYSSRELDEMAMEEMKKAVSLAPMFSEGHIGIASLYMKQGDWDGVIAECRLALKNIYYKTPESAYLNMGLAYYNMGDYEASVANLQKAVALKPGMASAYYNMGLAFERLKKRHKAITSYRKALELRPGYMEPYFRLGVVFVNTRKKEEARKAFEKVVELAPGSAMAAAAKDYLDLLR